MSEAKSGGCLGCIGIILAILIMWALLFGVTVGGKHYGLSSCDTHHGLKIDGDNK